MSKRFKVDIKSINKNFSFNCVPTWDSIGHINLMIDLEKKFQIKLDSSDTETMLDLKKIIICLKSYIG